MNEVAERWTMADWHFGMWLTAVALVALAVFARGSRWATAEPQTFCKGLFVVLCINGMAPGAVWWLALAYAVFAPAVLLLFIVAFIVAIGVQLWWRSGGQRSC